MDCSLYSELFEIIEKANYVYFACNPTIEDFTTTYKGTFVISSELGTMTIKADDVKFSTFDTFIRKNLLDKNKCVFTWDIKSYLSYSEFQSRFNNKSAYDTPICNVIDAKYGSYYKGNRFAKQPVDLKSAVTLCNAFISDKDWNRVWTHAYKKLCLKTIPALENQRIVDSDSVKIKHVSYEIEAQVNGRLSNHKVAKNYLNAHTLTPEQKQSIRPLFIDDDGKLLYVSFDYVNMEVAVLSWLSHDEELAKLLKSSADFYRSFCDEFDLKIKDRKFAKAIFIPLIYGMQPSGLSEQLKISIQDAESITSRVKQRFKKAFSWLEEKKSNLNISSIAIDVLGRARDFSKEPFYKVYNFHIQSPASLFCLAKLADISERFSSNLMFSIHDAYFLFTNINDSRNLIEQVKTTLESEHPLFPGLRIHTSCKVGLNLSSLVSI